MFEIFISTVPLMDVKFGSMYSKRRQPIKFDLNRKRIYSKERAYK